MRQSLTRTFYVPKKNPSDCVECGAACNKDILFHPSVFVPTGQVPSETCMTSSPSRELLGLIRGKLKQASSFGNVVGLACTNTFFSLPILIPGGLGVVLLHLPASFTKIECNESGFHQFIKRRCRLLLGVEPGMKVVVLTVNSSENKHRRYEGPELESVRVGSTSHGVDHKLWLGFEPSAASIRPEMYLAREAQQKREDLPCANAPVVNTRQPLFSAHFLAGSPISSSRRLDS
ncbi:hypothetical protein EV421DRAFT_2019508 [Armillaria borealis]|uniref:Uncharacterized protein n=1 Tax=Armillaria borealis TaxID=47425 RepID=A0AA39JJB9_9AGAR|nr:hypothetical protein EV421DRAFT_2019508 [Armillaria borealis]